METLRREPLTRTTRVFWVVFAAVLLLELAWSAALPAFRGLDEFAHAFRADSLVHGQLLSRTTTTRGHGQLVSVDADLARAARPECRSYRYTAHDDCSPAATDGSDRVVQASSAASYDPVYYAVVGTLARPFDGVAALFAMRVATAVIAAALVGWAAAVLARWDTSGWTLSGVLLVATPIAAYSGAVAAPNAVAYGAGLLFWSAAVTLLVRPGAPPLGALVTGAVLLEHTHTTGMMWLAVSALALLVLRGPRWWVDWVREDAPRRLGAVALVGLSGVAAFGWVRWAGTNSIGTPDSTVPLPSVVDLLGQQVVWTFQTVGAFPDRTTPAPIAVYALWFAPLAVLLVAGVRNATVRQRRALALLSVAWVALPVCLTLVSFRALSYAWQGRYALPLVSGIVLLAAAAAARSTRRPPAHLPVVVALTATAHAWCVASVARGQAGRGLGYDLVDHLPLGPVVVPTLALLGGLAPALLLLSRGAPSGDVPGTDRRTVAAGPTVLMVVPTLGTRPELLQKCLASITAQGRTDVDLVVVAPESPATASLAREAGARLVPDPGRGGLSGALNAAVAHARPGTTYFAWLGDDDLLCPGSLDTTVAALEEHPGASMVYGWCDYVNDQDEVLFRSRAGAWAARILAFGPNLVPQPGSLMRMSAVQDVGGLDEGLRLALDLDLFLRLRRCGTLLAVRQTLAQFRWHADSLTVSQGNASMSESDAVRRRHLRLRTAPAYYCARVPGRWALAAAKRRVHRNAAAARTVPALPRRGDPALEQRLSSA